MRPTAVIPSHFENRLIHARHPVSVSGLAPYECVTCGRRYWHPSSLRNHQKIHEGLTQCPLCGRVFGRVPDLRIHLRDVHLLTVDDVQAIVPTREKY